MKILIKQYPSCCIFWGKEMETTEPINKQWERLTFSCIEGSSWFASPGLPGGWVGEGTNEIFLTAVQNHFTHLMKLSRIVEPTVKLGISIGKFYKQQKFFLKALRLRKYLSSSAPSSPALAKYNHLSFSMMAFCMLDPNPYLSQFC